MNEWKTISELMEGIEVPGSKVLTNRLRLGYQFRPYFFELETRMWVGLSGPVSEKHPMDRAEWKLDVPTKTLYQWLFYDMEYEFHVAEKYFFENEEHAKKFARESTVLLKAIKRLDYTAVTVEAE
jgi:hypothetical protein